MKNFSTFKVICVLIFVFACFPVLPSVLFADTVSVKIPAKFAYVGHYTTEKREASTAKGIEVFSIGEDGAWNLAQTFELLNPSFLAMDSQKRFLYACQGDGKEVSAFSIDQETGKITFLNKAQTSGVNGVHLALSSKDDFLVVANYSAGTVDSFAVNQDGSIGDRISTYNTSGDLGALKSQAGSYPHQVTVIDDRYVVVPDKGRDVVHVMKFDPKTGALEASDTPFMYSRPGVGSRHAAFHPTFPYAYVIEECDNSITACGWDAENGVLTPIQWVPVVPDSYFFKYRGTNEEGGAAIGVDPDGKFVYGTQRGLNTIAVFAVDEVTGRLSSVEYNSTRGVRPRFFTFDPSGKYIFVANQIGDNIVAFERDRGTGKLSFLGDVAQTDAPVCILFK
jgi:6-phosphogluconolactonase (cycloisomerase 2 family)